MSPDCRRQKKRITAVVLIGQTEDSRISVRLLELVEPSRDDVDEDEDEDVCDHMKRSGVYQARI